MRKTKGKMSCMLKRGEKGYGGINGKIKKEWKRKEIRGENKLQQQKVQKKT